MLTADERQHSTIDSLRRVLCLPTVAGAYVRKDQAPGVKRGPGGLRLPTVFTYFLHCGVQGPSACLHVSMLVGGRTLWSSSEQVSLPTWFP